MKCGKPSFLITGVGSSHPCSEQDLRPLLPDVFIDCLTGTEIPFTNKDHIRQKILRFLLEERGYHKEDFRVDREISFALDGRKIISLVDISVIIGGKTVMVWKCASGSLVSRERQIIASARLLEDYVVPFAAVTNGADLELLDSLTEKVIGCGFSSLPSREELTRDADGAAFSAAKRKKIINEQRILYTYDGIGCPAGLENPAEG